MEFTLSEQWTKVLEKEFTKDYFTDLTSFLNDVYRKKTCYPSPESIFRAFNLCDFDETRVVILGQDPYHGPGQADGLAFSVPNGIKAPPSLRNIIKEIEEDTQVKPQITTDLSSWAQQGVLLLNASLSVEEKKPGSHLKMGWEQFTDAYIQAISKEKSGVIFMLWGGFAQKKKKLIDVEKHHILISGHPSPLSANRGYWFGNKHFTKVNEILIRKGENPIQW